MSNVLAVSFADPVTTAESQRIPLELAGLGDPQIWQVPERPLPFRCTDEVMNAWGTRLRLRSLVAMGHNERRIGEAIGISREKVTAIVNGQVTEIRVELARNAVDLWEAWWDKVPPTVTHTQKAAFHRARAKAARRGWCCPLGLDEELIDSPDYVPGAGWLPATGTGIAEDFPLGIKEAALCHSCTARVITAVTPSTTSTRVFTQARRVRRLRAVTRRAETTSQRRPKWTATANGRSGRTAMRPGARIRGRAARIQRSRAATGSQVNEWAGQGNGGGFSAIRARRAG